MSSIDLSGGLCEVRRPFPPTAREACARNRLIRSGTDIPTTAFTTVCDDTSAVTEFMVSSTSLGLHSVVAEFTVETLSSSGHPRGMPLVAHMAALQASKRVNHWHHRVQDSIEKRTPYKVVVVTKPTNLEMNSV
jgi:hypothetical protein